MEQIRTGLRSIMADLLRTRTPEEAVVLAWPLVCGKEVAARTQATEFVEGVLRVKADDPSWRNQLVPFVPRYLSGFRELLGDLVREIRFF